MPANTLPIFSEAANLSWAVVATANTAKDGTGTVQLVFTAGADGSWLEKLICRPQGANVVSVLRIFINNGSTNATATNNSLLTEVTLPAITNSEVSAQNPIEIPLKMMIPAGYKINAVVGTTVAGWAINAIGGNY